MKRSVGGVDFDRFGPEEAALLIVESAVAGIGGRVVTPNVSIVRAACGDPALGGLVATADLVLADGMPLVWAASLAGVPLEGRVAGSTLGPRLVEMASSRHLKVFLLGGGEGTAQRAAAVLATRYADLEVGWHFPPYGFERDARLVADIELRLTSFGDCICLVGLGFPKQDLLGRRLLLRFPRCWFIGAGATLGFIAGDLQRAPRWMQRCGLEWLHRLLHEPVRLFGRYARDVPFTLRLLARAAWQGLAIRHPR